MATRARLFIPREKLGPHVVLDGAEHHYLVHVLRLRPGALVTLLDGQGLTAESQVAQVGEQTIELAVSQISPVESLRARLVLLQGLLKGDKQDFVIQKATELGVSRIVPVACERSVPQLAKERAEQKRRRWIEIARHAAQQCRRADVPEISLPMSFAEALADAQGQKLLLFEGSAPPLGQVLLPISADGAGGLAVSMLIGPEGGLAPGEVAAAQAAGFAAVSLGPLILRAETAVVATLAVVGYHLHLQGAPLAESR